MKPGLAARAARYPDSPMRKLTPLAERAEAEGVHVHRLNIGQPDLETPEPIRQAVRDYDAEVYAYSRSEGDHAALSVFQEYYLRCGWSLSQDELLVTTGGSEALLFAFLVLCDPGDRILVPDPCYPSYRTFAQMAGVELVPIPTRVEEGYRLPPRRELDALVDGRTRAILVTNPSNPTGAVLSPEEIEAVTRTVRQRNLFLIADEVYREFLFDGARTAGALDLSEIVDRVVVCDSVSKRWSACGVRIGCMVSRNTELIGAALKLARSRLSAPLLGQVAIARTHGVEPGYMEATVARYQRRRDAVLEALEGVSGLIAPRPRGAFYTMLRLPVESSEAFSRWLLTDFSHEGETVLLSPGPGFYIQEGRGADEVRLAFVLERERLRRAAACLRRALEEYPASQVSGSSM